MHDKYPTKANWEKYIVQRNLCTKLKRKSVRCYFSERCGNDSNPSDFLQDNETLLHKQRYRKEKL